MMKDCGCMGAFPCEAHGGGKAKNQSDHVQELVEAARELVLNPIMGTGLYERMARVESALAHFKEQP
jgi:hypothetical protein